MTTNDAAAAAISIEHARKQYGKATGGRLAVSDVSIEVSQGAVHGLLGPNGAGKTTTIKMLLGLVRPTGGTFSILGVPSTHPGAKRMLGYLPEQPYFPTQLTAMEAMTLYGRLSGLPGSEIARQSPVLLAKVGLDGRESTQLSRFSRGMLQRLGIAQALVGDPKVLVLDEPASGLDPVGQRDVRNLMRDLRDDGASILLSSHQLSEAESICDEVSILAAGEVAARGTLDDLLDIRGEVTIRARGEGELPAALANVAHDARCPENGEWTCSVPEDAVRHAVDTLDDADWHLISVEPSRDSLEDYFAKMLAPQEVAADA